MSEILLEDAPQKAKDLFNKGFVALERNNLDYACDMFMAALAICPGLLRARKFLRAAEIRQFKAKKGGKLTHIMSSASGMPAYLKTMGLVKSGKAEKALEAAEGLLRADPLNLRFVLAFAQAAALDEFPEAAVQTLEIARDHYPDDTALLKSLAENYQATGDTKQAQQVYERLYELHPNDPALLKAMKDAMAMDSIQKDGWADNADSGGSFRNMVRDTKEAQLLEQAGKAVKTDKDADALIEDALAKIEAEPDNINYYRNLARLYSQKERVDEAVTTLEKAFELSSGDPEVDAALGRARTQKFDFKIKALSAAGDAEGAAAMEHEKAQFQFEDLQSRVERYPNDLSLRFDLGIMLFQNDYLNEAIQQFQLAQRAAQHRVRALYYLGMCFKSKGQYDMAVQQLEDASKDLTGMDDTKKDIVYELGLIAEAMENGDKAAGYFKEIYQADISYRDVAEKVENVYSR